MTGEPKKPARTKAPADDQRADGDQMRRNFPNAVLLRTEGERWVIP